MTDTFFSKRFSNSCFSLSIYVYQFTTCRTEKVTIQVFTILFQWNIIKCSSCSEQVVYIDRRLRHYTFVSFNFFLFIIYNISFSKVRSNDIGLRFPIRGWVEYFYLSNPICFPIFRLWEFKCINDLRGWRSSRWCCITCFHISFGRNILSNSSVITHNFSIICHC